jgi:translation elongation factor EF-G
LVHQLSACLARVIAGEVHLETCIKDLRERFARVELTVSPPLVAFRESVADPAEAPDTVHRPPKARPGHCNTPGVFAMTAGGQVKG